MDSALVILLAILIFAGVFILIADAIIKNRFTLPLPVEDNPDININIENDLEPKELGERIRFQSFEKEWQEYLDTVKKRIEEIKKEPEEELELPEPVVEKPVEPVEKEPPKEPITSAPVEGLPKDPKDDTYEILCRYLTQVYYRWPREEADKKRDQAIVHNVIERIKSLNNSVTQDRIAHSENPTGVTPPSRPKEPRPVM